MNLRQEQQEILEQNLRTLEAAFVRNPPEIVGDYSNHPELSALLEEFELSLECAERIGVKTSEYKGRLAAALNPYEESRKQFMEVLYSEVGLAIQGA